eukprot:TRINITY_DN4401_c0_g1_i1.p1 TRINITY_DN4401_c0_g1~~TRINITY_DN4401_c0_g1_i1.p1  ORF type:complete len:463 (+),score=77.49 TRINITY_DN4401_c0_g1_i1:2-1390(+)
MDLTKYRWIPMRLNEEERYHLQLIEQSLNVSEYTDEVDVIDRSFFSRKDSRIRDNLNEMFSILSGLLVAANYIKGSKKIAQTNFYDHEEFFQSVFEVGRRYKIMNPDKMRSSYGKMMYMLQDSVFKSRSLGFELVGKIKTVYTYLKSKDGLQILNDPAISIACEPLIFNSIEEREFIYESKKSAISYLKETYVPSVLENEEELMIVLNSITDNETYIKTNVESIDTLLEYLEKDFIGGSQIDISIRNGKGGARLTHSHSKQCTYVKQTLYLWREIIKYMFYLWGNSEKDLLSPSNEYKLRDTGQGLNRVQQAPKLYDLMAKIMKKASNLSNEMWVGSKVVHLGDHDVPNAFMFIDKYNQVPRILNPIVNVLREIDHINETNPELSQYFTEKWKGAENLKLTILKDFFQHGFDGSGANNYYDAGSCIDGRLTSAWNWCSRLDKKSYSAVFYLTGFIGFDGDWR